MSIILDALRRKTERGRTSQPGSGSPGSDAVLATLGYSGARNRRRWSLRAIAASAVIALILGFAVVAVPVYWLAPTVPDEPVVQVVDQRDRTQVQTPSAESDSTIGHAANSRSRGREPEPRAAPPAQSASIPAPSPAQEPVNAARAPDREPPTSSLTQVPRRSVAEPTVDEQHRQTVTSAPRPVVTARDRETEPPLPKPAQRATPAESSSQEAASISNHFGLAVYYQRIGDPTRALAEYQVLLNQNERSAEVHNNVGLLYQDRGDSEAAIAQFLRAIEIDPRHVSAHNNLGIAYLRDGRLDMAASQLAIALTIEPRNVESLVNLGLVHQAAGRLADAMELLERAVAIDPRHPGSHYNLAVVAEASGNDQKAAAHYRAFLRYGTIQYPELAAQVRTRLSAQSS